MEHCQTYLEPHANMTFTQEELDYIFLVYCSANSSFSKDKWNQEKDSYYSTDSSAYKRKASTIQVQEYLRK